MKLIRCKKTLPSETTTSTTAIRIKRAWVEAYTVYVVCTLPSYKIARSLEVIKAICLAKDGSHSWYNRLKLHVCVYVCVHCSLCSVLCGSVCGVWYAASSFRCNALWCEFHVLKAYKYVAHTIIVRRTYALATDSSRRWFVCFVDFQCLFNSLS